MFSSLSRSVGYFGVNLFHDVIEVQYRLKHSGFPDLVVDGNCGQKTVAAIREFQRRFMSLPDGLVEVNGATIRRLQSTAISQGNARPYAPAPQASNALVSGGVRRNVNELSVSPQAEALLKNYESLRLKPYFDGTGQEISEYIKGATIGYGHLINGKGDFEVLKIINGESQVDIDEAWLRWKYANGHITNGVVNRRKSEPNVFHNGVYAR